MIAAAVVREHHDTYTHAGTFIAMAALVALALVVHFGPKVVRSVRNNRRSLRPSATRTDRRAVGPAALANRRSSRRQASLGATRRRPELVVIDGITFERHRR